MDDQLVTAVRALVPEVEVRDAGEATHFVLDDVEVYACTEPPHVLALLRPVDRFVAVVEERKWRRRMARSIAKLLTSPAQMALFGAWR